MSSRAQAGKTLLLAMLDILDLPAPLIADRAIDKAIGEISLTGCIAPDEIPLA